METISNVLFKHPRWSRSSVVSNLVRALLHQVGYGRHKKISKYNSFILYFSVNSTPVSQWTGSGVGVAALYDSWIRYTAGQVEFDYDRRFHPLLLPRQLL